MADKKPMDNTPEAERREVRWAKIGELELDRQNPRLPPNLADTSADGLLSTLAKEYDLTELGQSMADHGYFSEEPMVVVVEDGLNIVVEGNRRLAALKLLENPASAPASYRKRWEELSRNRKVLIREVPILVYDNRPEVTPYLGYRHITGVLPWGPYQKARYIAQQMENAGSTLAEIARTIGSKSATVREHYVTYTLLRQAEEDFDLDVRKPARSFGVLRRALVNPNIRAFIGLSFEGSEDELRRPLPGDKVGPLQELFSFMFGTSTETAVLRDSRQLTALGLVLSKPETTEVLRRTRNLDEAFRLAGGEEQLAIDIIDDAEVGLREAIPLSSRHRESRLVLRAVARLRKTFEVFDRLFPKEDDQL
jgi:hypothetical protein